jgi:hypothetical protein
MRHLALAVAIVLSVGLAWETPAVATTPGTSQVARHKRFSPKRMFRSLKLRALRTWKRWNRLPTRSQALAPLRRMIRSGRISGGDVDRVRSLYPGLGTKSSTATIRSSRNDSRMKPLFRLLDSGRISQTDFISTEKALGIQ